MHTSYGKYIFSLLLLSSNGIVASFIALKSNEIVFLRATIGWVCLMLLFFLAARGKLTAHRYKRDLGFICLSGASMAVNWLFLYEAYDRIGVGVSSLICYCAPILMMAFSAILFKEKLTPVKTGGFVVVLCGVVLVNGEIVVQGGSGFGIFCAIMSMLGFAGLVLCNKMSHNIVGMENALLQLTACLFVITLFQLLQQDLIISVQPSDIVPLLVLGALNTGISCYFYFSSMGHLPVQTVAILGYLEPLCTVILSVIILHETMAPLQILGAVLILGGALFAECFPQKVAKKR